MSSTTAWNKVVSATLAAVTTTVSGSPLPSQTGWSLLPGLPRSTGFAGSLPPEVVQERVQRAMRAAELPPAQWVGGCLEGLFTDAAPAGVVEEALAMMLEVRAAGMRPMLHSFAEADLWDVLPRIHVPTPLLYGDADQRSPLEVVARDLHAKIPGSRLVVLPGVGHQCDMEAPDRFNAEVRSFLRSVQR
jgi:pimeloyl-ACP methyl ester carboxylesterase